jgi:hypothetical protein
MEMAGRRRILLVSLLGSQGLATSGTASIGQFVSVTRMAGSVGSVRKKETGNVRRRQRPDYRRHAQNNRCDAEERPPLAAPASPLQQRRTERATRASPFRVLGAGRPRRLLTGERFKKSRRIAVSKLRIDLVFVVSKPKARPCWLPIEQAEQANNKE